MERVYYPEITDNRQKTGKVKLLVRGSISSDFVLSSTQRERKKKLDNTNQKEGFVQTRTEQRKGDPYPKFSGRYIKKYPALVRPNISSVVVSVSEPIERVTGTEGRGRQSQEG